MHGEDVENLRNLVTTLKPDTFRAKNLCPLNPTFSLESIIPRAADADFLKDETLIDIKTTKNPKLTKSYITQLLGYVTLNEIGNVGGQSPKPTINKIAIYFARHASLHVMDLSEVITTETYPDFVAWFVEEARKVTD